MSNDNLNDSAKPANEGGAPSPGRREALIKIGKYVAYAPPMMMKIGTARAVPISDGAPAPAPAPPP